MNDLSYGPGAVPAAQAAVEERAAFLKKTYATLFAGILGWCVVMWAVGEVPAVQRLAVALWGNWIVGTVLLMGGGWLVQTFSDRKPFGVVLYAAYVFLFGLLVGPLVLIAQNSGMADLVSQASLVTGLVFLGLTLYVFVTGKDFSFLGGMLAILFFALLGIVLCAWLFGFQLGAVFCGFAALLYSGYILYNTSQILHHTPLNAHVSAAANLFASVVLLFYYLLSMFMASDD